MISGTRGCLRAALIVAILAPGIVHAVPISGVPYIHQVYDTDPGFDGRYACNATSALMAVQYYAPLPVHPLWCPEFNGVPQVRL